MQCILVSGGHQFIPEFSNSHRTNTNIGKYVGEDRRVNPARPYELNYGMDSLLKQREHDILQHFLDSISPGSDLYKKSIRNQNLTYDDFAILQGLHSIFIDGYNKAFNNDVAEYDRWLKKEGIDITKPESVITHYIELSKDAQKIDWEQIQEYPLEMARSKNSVYSPEYYILKVIEAGNYHATSIRELVRFVPNLDYQTELLRTQDYRDLIILNFLKEQAKSFYTQDASFNQIKIDDLIKKFELSLQKAKQIPTTSKKSKRDVLDFCCEKKLCQLENYYKPKWGRGRAFDDRTSEVKKSKQGQPFGKPDVKNSGTMTKPANPRTIMDFFNWGINFKLFGLEFRIGPESAIDIWRENPANNPTDGGGSNGGGSGGGGSDGGGSDGGGSDGGGSGESSTGSESKQVDKKDEKETKNKNPFRYGPPTLPKSTFSLMPDLDEFEDDTDLISTK